MVATNTVNVPLSNYQPGGLGKWRAALAGVRTGASFAKLACLGDSTTAGGVANASPALYRPNSWPMVLASLLTARGLTASSNNAFGSGTGAAGSAIGLWDNRVSATGAWSQPTKVLGGFDAFTNGAGTYSFTTSGVTDNVDVYFLGDNGTVTINVDGGATLATLTASAGNGYSGSKVFKLNVPYTSGTNRVINIVWSAVNFHVVGLDAYLSTQKAVHCWNLGWGGAQTSDWVANVNTYDPLPSFKLLVPDLTVISLGINDWIAGVSVAAYSANLQTLITAAQLSGDVILMTPFPSATSVQPSATQAQYVAAMIALAVSNGIPYIGANSRFVSKAVMTANGFGSDSNHPNGLGHADVALAVMAAIIDP